MKSGRDDNIDILRFLGISGIILAHVSAPNWLYQLRTFDVPLMVFVSGLVMAGKQEMPSVTRYWLHRSQRLLVPVYLFLLLFFVAIYLVSFIRGSSMPFTNTQIIESFFLLEGIGFVWIIRVFLLIAIITPLCLKMKLKIRKDYCFLLWIVCLSLLPDIFIRCGIESRSLVIKEFVLYMIGYGAIFLAGLQSASRKPGGNWKELSVYICIFILLFAIYMKQDGRLPLFSTFKFPPQSLYIFYGIIVSLVLWNAIRHFRLPEGKLRTCILFVGCNTIWIYLIHIPFIFYMNIYLEQWWLRFIAFYTISIVLCALKNRVLDSYFKRYSWVPYLKG